MHLILERLELQALQRKVRGPPIREQPLAIGRHEVRHRAATPAVAVQPQAAVHGVNHSIASFRKFGEPLAGGNVRHSGAGGCGYWQLICPSCVAGATGEMLPM